MSDLQRLIEGLQNGDSTAIAVLIFTVVGTIVLVGAAGIIRRRRRL